MNREAKLHHYSISDILFPSLKWWEPGIKAFLGFFRWKSRWIFSSESRSESNLYLPFWIYKGFSDKSTQPKAKYRSSTRSNTRISYFQRLGWNKILFIEKITLLSEQYTFTKFFKESIGLCCIALFDSFLPLSPVQPHIVSRWEVGLWVNEVFQLGSQALLL